MEYNTSDLTLKQILKVWHVFYFKYASFFNIQTWGSDNGAPYPQIGVQKICKLGQIFLWSEELMP